MFLIFPVLFLNEFCVRKLHLTHSVDMYNEDTSLALYSVENNVVSISSLIKPQRNWELESFSVKGILVKDVCP